MLFLCASTDARIWQEKLVWERILIHFPYGRGVWEVHIHSRDWFLSSWAQSLKPTPLFLSKAFDGVGCVLFQPGNKVHLPLLPLFTVPAQGFLMTLQWTVQSDSVHISHPHTWRENEWMDLFPKCQWLLQHLPLIFQAESSKKNGQSVVLEGL